MKLRLAVCLLPLTSVLTAAEPPLVTLALADGWDRFAHRSWWSEACPRAAVWHISQDRAGVMWLATESGLHRLDPASKALRHYSHNPADPSSLSNSMLRSTYEDREGLRPELGRFMAGNNERTGAL